MSTIFNYASRMLHARTSSKASSSREKEKERERKIKSSSCNLFAGHERRPANSPPCLPPCLAGDSWTRGDDRV
ncbi:hypothetical protein X777_01809 [Ooceraea biroi]|uniref:Uncharacterized protein n=1 Tax=Ooceraea biroi TaxID=2015173 RepID=A0A026WMQ7_OOCBI|nr:hypothetical protein X777_01809 [Ooceraea biroi]